MKKIILLSCLLSMLGISGCANDSTSITLISKKSKEEEKTDIAKEKRFNPITDEIKALAANKTPTLDPTTIVFSKKDSYDFENQDYKDINLASADVANRGEHKLIYLFQGKYSEGYQGDYHIYYANIYLWDDGLLTGKSNNEVFKGYWYNDEDGDGVITNADKIGMVCDENEFEKYNIISCSLMEYSGDWVADLYINIGENLQRSIYVYGYMYYETIAIAIDSDKTGIKFQNGDPFDIDCWSVVEILQNLKYRYVFERTDMENMEIKWTIPDGLVVNGVLSKQGTFEIKASFNNFEASASIVVK